jgi:hypothetical protein
MRINRDFTIFRTKNIQTNHGNVKSKGGNFSKLYQGYTVGNLDCVDLSLTPVAGLFYPGVYLDVTVCKWVERPRINHLALKK